MQLPLSEQDSYINSNGEQTAARISFCEHSNASSPPLHKLNKFPDTETKQLSTGEDPGNDWQDNLKDFIWEAFIAQFQAAGVPSSQGIRRRRKDPGGWWSHVAIGCHEGAPADERLQATKFLQRSPTRKTTLGLEWELTGPEFGHWLGRTDAIAVDSQAKSLPMRLIAKRRSEIAQITLATICYDSQNGGIYISVETSLRKRGHSVAQELLRRNADEAGLESSQSCTSSLSSTESVPN